MNILKKTALTFIMAMSFGAASTIAFAEEAAKAAVSPVAETISHLEKAIAEVNKSDFSAARLHLKAARTASEQITGHDDIVKQANANVVQGQIQSNSGEVKKSADELNKALLLYKSL